MFWSPFLGIFRGGVFLQHITKTTKPMYSYKILSLKYVIHNICENIKYR